MKMIDLRPVSGRRVRKPDGDLLAEAGETVTEDSFWRRRLRDGDVVAISPPAPEIAPETGPAAEPRRKGGDK
jgi:hypothetical protein